MKFVSTKSSTIMIQVADQREDYHFLNLYTLCMKVPKYLLAYTYIAITQSLAIVSIASRIARPIYVSDASAVLISSYHVK